MITTLANFARRKVPTKIDASKLSQQISSPSERMTFFQLIQSQLFAITRTKLPSISFTIKRNKKNQPKAKKKQIKVRKDESYDKISSYV